MNKVYIVAEIGINHNGDIDIARRLIGVAAKAGCDAVKFQKREPSVCVPKGQWGIERDTPWGRMTYIEYRNMIEFNSTAFRLIDEWCFNSGIRWFSSVCDCESVDFFEAIKRTAATEYFYKVPSSQLTNRALLNRLTEIGKRIILSTGMSTMDEIRHAVGTLGDSCTHIMHCTSAYPCRAEELNLRMIETLKREFPNHVIGYSGHEVGLQTTLAAVALGARMIERHITLDRAMWGTDQAASVEPQGLKRLVRDIRVIERAMGDGVKHIYESEREPMKRLRGIREEALSSAF